MRLVLIISVLLTNFSILSECLADYREDAFLPLAGWSHSPQTSNDSSLGHGVFLSGNQVIHSSPVIAEISGSSEDGKEVAAASADGNLYVYNSNGTERWSVQVTTCGSNGNRIASSPAVGELYGDGVPYVVIGYGGVGQGSCDGGVAAYRGDDGQLEWQFSLRDWASRQGYKENLASVWGTPALADADGDGQLEIAFGGFDRNIYLLDAGGKVLKYIIAADTVWSSAAFADVEGDSKLEFVIATDISRNRVIRPPTPNGGYVYAFDVKAARSKRVDFRTGQIWLRAVNQTPFSAPVVGDVIPNVEGPEIIIASGYYFNPRKKGKWVKVISGRNGKVLKTLKAPSASATSLAIGDINGDGVLDIVGTFSGSRNYGGDGDGRVVAWSPAISKQPLWTVKPRERSQTSTFGFQSSAALADLDGNGSIEVVVENGQSVVVLEGRDGKILTCEDKVCSDGRKSMYVWGGVSSTVAIGDLDGDGKPEIVSAGSHRARKKKGALFTFTDFTDLGSQPGSQAPYSLVWPMYRGNAHRSGSNH
ncbi:MAG: VCBS repeat-containing protein [Bdellovibrionales bacterium]|nr:VCBS repeat-containing protein [Bdellovibrionales bacterium]